MPRIALPLIALVTAASRLAAAAGSADGAIHVLTRDAAGQPVSNAVVSLTRLGDPEAAPTPPNDPVPIGQRHQEFETYVTPIVMGTRVVFPNQDTVKHHVYSVSKAKRFEIPLYIGDSKETVLFDRPGVVTLGCNIHDWMIAYVVVLTTSHFTKTGADGTGLISGLPPGTYDLVVWHPLMTGTVQQQITVAPAGDATQVIPLSLHPDRRVRRAPDSGSSGYR